MDAPHTDDTDTDTETQRLWHALVDAEYAYLKHIQPQAIRNVQRDLAGLVLNTVDPACRSLFGLDSHPEETLTGEQRHMVRQVLREFHPDKNPTRVFEAQEYYVLLSHWVKERQWDKIQTVYATLDVNAVDGKDAKSDEDDKDDTHKESSEKTWQVLRQLKHAQLSGTYSNKIAELDTMKRSLWYLWRDPTMRSFYRQFFMTPQELDARMQKEIARLKEENQQLREETQRLHSRSVGLT